MAQDAHPLRFAVAGEGSLRRGGEHHNLYVGIRGQVTAQESVIASSTLASDPKSLNAARLSSHSMPISESRRSGSPDSARAAKDLSPVRPPCWSCPPKYRDISTPVRLESSATGDLDLLLYRVGIMGTTPRHPIHESLIGHLGATQGNPGKTRRAGAWVAARGACATAGDPQSSKGLLTLPNFLPAPTSGAVYLRSTIGGRNVPKNPAAAPAPELISQSGEFAYKPLRWRNTYSVSQQLTAPVVRWMSRHLLTLRKHRAAGQ